MIRIEKCVFIKRPVDEVFAYVTDMHKVQEWLPVKAIRAISDEPMRVGASFVQTAEFMGRSFDATTEVTQYEVPHIFAFKVTQGPFPLTNTMKFQAHDDGTNLTVVGEADPGRALKFAGPFITSLVKMQMDMQVGKLKEILESPQG